MANDKNENALKHGAFADAVILRGGRWGRGDGV